MSPISRKTRASSALEITASSDREMARGRGMAGEFYGHANGPTPLRIGPLDVDWLPVSASERAAPGGYGWSASGRGGGGSRPSLAVGASPHSAAPLAEARPAGQSIQRRFDSSVPPVSPQILCGRNLLSACYRLHADCSSPV